VHTGQEKAMMKDRGATSMTQVSGKNIRLYLVDGSPTGILTAEIMMGWTGKVLSFPRGLLPEALKRPECAKTGVYFLTGFDDEQQSPILYIGESDDVAKRLTQHDRDEDKAFFEHVTLVVSKDENLTKSHVRYLENRLIDIAKSNGMILLKNGTQGSVGSLPEAEISDVEYCIHQLQILLPVLGLTFLQERPRRKLAPLSDGQASTEALPSITFEITSFKGQVKATAYEQDGAFVVEKGAIIRNMQANDYDLKVGERYILRYTQQYLQTKSVNGTDTVLELLEDLSFKSPSGAANFVCGTSINGNNAWKVKGSGQTYGEWRQAQLEAVQ
jgi:predicted GIY-YIG superfamily endonuclease